MIKLIHGADFHLDSPFSGLAPDQAAQRRREQRELLARLAQLSREREADLVLLSGDLLDGRQTYRETAQALSQALGEIPCQVLISPGNHDPYTAKSLYAALDWPDNVHIFSTEAPQNVEFPALKCAVWGSAFTAPPPGGRPPGGLSGPGAGGVDQAGRSPRGGGGQGELRPPSPKRPSPAAAWTIWPWATSTNIAACSGRGTPSGPTPAVPRAGALDETGDKGVLYIEAEPGEL